MRYLLFNLKGVQGGEGKVVRYLLELKQSPYLDATKVDLV